MSNSIQTWDDIESIIQSTQATIALIAAARLDELPENTLSVTATTLHRDLVKLGELTNDLWTALRQAETARAEAENLLLTAPPPARSSKWGEAGVLCEAEGFTPAERRRASDGRVKPMPYAKRKLCIG